MAEIKEKVGRYIAAKHLFTKGDRLLVGLSGGADSVCLLYMLLAWRERCPFTLLPVHVEHGVRGEESLEDAAFTERLCAGLGLPCHVEHVDMNGFALREKLSPEEAGRKLRYAAFKEALGESGGRIAVAHNRNDQAETVLLNLARGSGLRGLGGMRPVSGRIIRPLLETSRGEIEDWLKGRGITWRTDSTNDQLCYARNRIRHIALPALTESVNSAAAQHICRAAEKAAEADRYLEKLAEEKYFSLLQKETEKSIRLDAGKLLEEDPLMQEYLIRYVLRRVSGGLKDTGSVHVEAVRELLCKKSGKRLNLPGGVLAARAGESLVLSADRAGGRQAPGSKEAGGQPATEGSREAGGQPASDGNPKTDVPIQLADDSPQPEVFIKGTGTYVYGERIFRVKLTDWRWRGCPEEKKYTKWLAYDTMKNRLCLRTRRQGDYLVINAQGQHQSLKKYLIDHKVPATERDQLILLADGSHILWVVGLRISAAARVTRETETVLEITAEERPEMEG